MMGEVFIEVCGVGKKLKSKEVLKDVSVKIREGEKLGLIGKSGSGKSVFMLMLKGVEGYAPDSGEIIFRVAMCPVCSWVNLPSVGVCEKCGHRLELREVNYWRSGMRECE